MEWDSWQGSGSRKPRMAFSRASDPWKVICAGAASGSIQEHLSMSSIGARLARSRLAARQGSIVLGFS